jgi:hypothetical protein
MYKGRRAELRYTVVKYNSSGEWSEEKEGKRRGAGFVYLYRYGKLVRWEEK